MNPFNITSPRTTESDFVSYYGEKQELSRLLLSGEITEENCFYSNTMLENKYKERIFPEDCYVFTDENDFHGFLEYLKSIIPGSDKHFDLMFEEQKAMSGSVADDPVVEGFEYCMWVLSDGDDFTFYPELNCHVSSKGSYSDISERMSGEPR